MQSTNFNYVFWENQLNNLGYPLSKSKIPVQFLRDKRAIPPGVILNEATLFYHNELGIDIVILEFEKLPSRIGAARIARYWKKNQGGRQLIIFTDGIDSYVIVIPGLVEKPETKMRILSLSEKIFRTDMEALDSLKYIDDPKKLREEYDKNFLQHEKIRKDFFEDYRNIYRKSVETVKPVLQEHSNSYAQRFLGRLMFLYFLQRKGWLKGNLHFVDTIKDYTELNWVYYVGLCTEGNKELPYLDGTLFEREEYLTPEREKTLKNDMDDIFKEARDLFNQYNFTVDELSPKEVEVSLDPAMIGTIFENMLPENERGSKGTFYTPPEEVSFICRRALASYLNIPELVEKNGGNEILKDGISSLIESLNQEKSEKKVREIKEKVLSITVLDPAVGSGGFLLGMMQEMVSLLRQADESVGWNSDVEQFKEKILQNMFGFDIEDEAIEIARLRMWLSMIVDKKEPEALQSLDLNIVRISDSLIKSEEDIQRKLGDEMESTWDEMRIIREKFATAKKADVRARLRKDLQKKQSDVEKRTGVRGGIIESWVPKPVDIVVMNPPYVRQESISENKKKYYNSSFKMDSRTTIDKKSDLYSYFIFRAMDLINENGIVSVISSDKWLETEYGKDLQKKLSGRLIGVYGQRDRTFGADVNSVITIYTKNNDFSKGADFIYLESYSSHLVRNYVHFIRKDLKPGKWFYLRAPKMFMEKVYPKLTHRLCEFAEIKRGFTTGANDFFYMKDVSASYEADYLANPNKFEDWGVSAKNEKELKGQGLIYIENLLGDRFILEESDLRRIVKSPKELDKYVNTGNDLQIMCLYTKNPGKFTKKYIYYGEQKGFDLKPSTKNRRPWFFINQAKPTKLLITVNQMDRLFNPFIETEILVDKMFYLVYPRNKEEYYKLFILLNSTIFLTISELYGWRMGGGGGILTNTVEGYDNIPFFDFNKIDFSKIKTLFNREVKVYFKEVKMEDRRKLDEQLFKEMGIEKLSLDEFYEEFVELVEDRLIKGDRGLRSQETSNEQDN